MKTPYPFLSLLLACLLPVLPACKSAAPPAQVTPVPGDTVTALSRNIMVVFQDAQGRHWFGSWEDGAYCYDGRSLLHFSKAHGLPSDRVEEIQEDKAGNIFLNTNQGLCVYDGKSLRQIPESPQPDTAWKLLPDDLWFKCLQKPAHIYRYDGTYLHRLKLPRLPAAEQAYPVHSNAFSPYDVYRIYRDRKGHVWMGLAVYGVLRYDGKTFGWITESDVTEMHDGPSNGVRGILEDRDGRFWFNTEFRYAVHDHPEQETGPHGTPRFYARQPGIGSLDGKSDGNLREYLSIAQDTLGHVWFATYRQGAWRWDGKQITQYVISEAGQPVTLFYVYCDRAGTVWLGTHEQGAWRLEGTEFVRFMP